MAQQERVVEYFVVAVKAQDDREAELAFAYPNGDNESTREFCEGVAMFMFPHAFGQDWDKRSLPPPPMHNLFALTDVSGEHLYGASLCFYETLVVSEALPPLSAGTSYDDGESSSNNESTTVAPPPAVALPTATVAAHGVRYQAKAICLLSKRPFYTQLLRCLEQLFLLGTRQARANSDASSSVAPVRWHGVEKTLCNLLHEVPVPHRGLAVQLTVGDVDIVLERPLLQDFPFEMDAELMTYAFMMVEPKVMLQLYHHVLLEHRILVVCADSVLVTAIAEAVKCLAFPLTWLHVYIPHIPDSLDLSTLLEAPVPFIAGAHTQQLANVAIPPNVVKLVFTAGKFVLGATAAASEVALPPLPDASQKLATKLGTLRLPDFTAQKREFHEKLWNRRIQLQKLCMSTSVHGSSVHSSSNSSSGTDASSSSSILAKALFLTRPNALYRKVMKLYLEIMASLLRGYPQFVSSDGNQTAFESERFIERKPPSERAFYREFVHTALFQSFLAQHNDHLTGALSHDDAVKLQFVHRRLLNNHEDDVRGSFASDSSASKTFVAHAPQLPALPAATRKRSFVLPARLPITGSSSLGASSSASNGARHSITLEPVNVSIRFPDIDVSAFGEPRPVIFPAAAHDATTSSLGTFLHASSTTRHSTASKDVGVEWMQQLMKNVSLSTGPFKRRDVLTSTTATPALSSAVFKRSRTIDRILSKSSPSTSASTLSTALGANTASPFYRTMTQRALESTNSIFRATGTSHTLKTQQHDSATRAAPVVRSIWLITTSTCACSGEVVALTEALTHVLQLHERNSSAASDAYCALIDCLGACGHASEAKAVFEECLSGSHLVTLAPLARYKHFWKPFSSLMRCYVRNGLVQRAFDVLVQVEIDEEQHLDPALGSLCFGAQVLGSESEVLVERIYATFSCGNLGLYLAARDTGSGAEVVACESLAEQQRDSTNDDEDNNNSRSRRDSRSHSPPHTASVREYDVVETINGEVVLQSSLQQVVHCLKQAYRPVTITFLRGLPKLESLMNDSTGSAASAPASQRGAGSSAAGNLSDTQLQLQLDDHESKFRPRKDLCDRFGLLPQRGIRITTLADCTSCGARATLREIQDGWSATDANDYTTRCARCSHRFVPRLCVTLGAMTAFYQPPPPTDSGDIKRADAASSAPSQVRVEHCEYLSMLVIRKELANVAQKLPLTMLSMAELRELNPRIYWNIVVKLLSLAYPLDFLDLPDVTQSPPQDASDAKINDASATLDSDVSELEELLMQTLTRLHAAQWGHATWEHTLAATLARLEQHAREHSPESIAHAPVEPCVDADDQDSDRDDDGDDERRSCRTVSLVESSSTCAGDDDDEPVAKPRVRGGSLRLAPFQRKARTAPLSK